MLKPTDEEIVSVVETCKRIAFTPTTTGPIEAAILTAAASINKLTDAIHKRSEIPPEPISKEEFIYMYFDALKEARNIPHLNDDARTERFVMLLYGRICEKIELSRKST